MPQSFKDNQGSPQQEKNFASTGVLLGDKEFLQLRELVYKHFGINLTEQKRSLVIGRLQPLLRARGFTSFQQYYDFLVKEKSHSSLTELINRISTNYSFFYREKAHFEFFVRTALPEAVARLQQKSSNDIRIWCAGCSTGEEPYMLVMLMLDHFGLNYRNWDAGILATDISEQVLNFAKLGIYPPGRVEEMPVNLKKKFMSSLPNGDVSVAEQVKRDVTFRRFNLMNTQFPFKKKFHMIFCRNVMIYFDKETRDALVRRFHQFLEPGGYLFIGHSESLGREQQLYKYVMPATYQSI
ncbi:MAG: protein-glutamate O-methyltransferase CheR [Desulfobulbaceae bacterium]|nr:protein-glutamate O-methyltransferase CheR [Desulfobulbaceae bacterium]HIJ77992.1 protein-glutamate O-methyltransferase CheR [Deltaproteobacteria bacterium]